jgi:hypothetical protein
MNGIETALVRLSAFLEAAGVPYMVIGGIANLRWGRPRLTQELDVTVRVDLILAGLPYEEEAIARAVAFPMGGRPVKIRTAEDLVLHKIVSSRPRDREDVAGVITRQGARLGRGYPDPRVTEMATGLERPKILAFYRGCLRGAGAT